MPPRHAGLRGTHVQPAALPRLVRGRERMAAAAGPSSFLIPAKAIYLLPFAKFALDGTRRLGSLTSVGRSLEEVSVAAGRGRGRSDDGGGSWTKPASGAPSPAGTHAEAGAPSSRLNKGTAGALGLPPGKPPALSEPEVGKCFGEFQLHTHQALSLRPTLCERRRGGRGMGSAAGSLARRSLRRRAEEGPQVVEMERKNVIILFRDFNKCQNVAAQRLSRPEPRIPAQFPHVPVAVSDDRGGTLIISAPLVPAETAVRPFRERWPPAWRVATTSADAEEHDRELLGTGLGAGKGFINVSSNPELCP